jgi:hypothetical protein
MPIEAADLADVLIAQGLSPAESEPITAENGGLRGAVERAGIDPAVVADLLARRFGRPRASIEAMSGGRPLTEALSIPFLRDHAVFPYEGDGGEARLALADPSDREVVRLLEPTLGRPLVCTVVRRWQGSERDPASVSELRDIRRIVERWTTEDELALVGDAASILSDDELSQELHGSLPA